MIEAPLARPPSDKLIVKHLDGETFIFDRKHNTACCLNAAADLLWRRCDGTTTVAALAALLREELSLDADEATVWAGLESLKEIHLLKDCPVAPPITAQERQRQRRKLIMAIGTTITTAFVTSIVAPMAAHAASIGCTVTGKNSSTCSSGNCCCAPNNTVGTTGSCVHGGNNCNTPGFVCV